MTDILLDSNVVLRLLAEGDPGHDLVDRAVVKALRAGHHLRLAPQVIMESWVVLTRPQNVNGFGWSPSIAKLALEGALERFRLLPETPDVFAHWWQIVGSGISGKRAHDARLVALMRVHQVSHILTFNSEDFAAFEHITVWTPGEENMR